MLAGDPPVAGLFIVIRACVCFTGEIQCSAATDCSLSWREGAASFGLPEHLSDPSASSGSSLCPYLHGSVADLAMLAAWLGLSRYQYVAVLQGKSAMGMYKQFEKGRNQGDFSMLPELHVILSGMKVGGCDAHCPVPLAAFQWLVL